MHFEWIDSKEHALLLRRKGEIELDFFSEGFDGFCAAVDASETPVLFCERFDERSNIWNFKEHCHDCIEKK